MTVAMFRRAMKLGKDRNGFSLIEVVITIIIIGLSLSAITESFIVGSAKSVNIVSEETVMNTANQIMSELNYCRNGGTVSGVCVSFKTGFWNNPSGYYTAPQGPISVNGRCLYTRIAANCAVFSNNNNGSGGSIRAGACGRYIQVIVRAGWFALNAKGKCPSSLPLTYPFITLSNVYANY